MPRRYESEAEQKATGGYFKCGTWKDGGYAEGCGWAGNVNAIREEHPELLDDGRIRGPEDVPPRLDKTGATALGDLRLSERDRRVLVELITIGLEHSSVYVIAGREWLALQAGVSPKAARLALSKLERYGYIRTERDRSKMTRVVREQLEDYPNVRPPLVYEIRKAPSLTTCEVCGGPMRAFRSTRKTCSDRCRLRLHRRQTVAL